MLALNDDAPDDESVLPMIEHVFLLLSLLDRHPSLPRDEVERRSDFYANTVQKKFPVGCKTLLSALNQPQGQ